MVVLAMNSTAVNVNQYALSKNKVMKIFPFNQVFPFVVTVLITLIITNKNAIPYTAYTIDLISRCKSYKMVMMIIFSNDLNRNDKKKACEPTMNGESFIHEYSINYTLLRWQ